MGKRLLLFDIDWTLLEGGLAEHIDGFAFAWKKVLGIDAKLSDWPDHHGQPDVVLLSLVPQLSHGVRPEIIKEKIGELKQAKIDYFFSHKQKDYRKSILPGVIELLATLKQMGIALAIKSGNLEKIGSFRLQTAEIADYFITGGWGDNVISKADSLKIAISNVQNITGKKIEKENIYDVGDSKYDIEADRSVGINSIGVCTGYDSREVLQKAGAHFVLSNLTKKEEFLNIIRK